MRFDVRGPPARNVGGKPGDQEEQSRHAAEGQRIEGRGLEQLRAHRSPRRKRPGRAEHDADGHDRHSVGDDVGDDAAGVGAERQTDGDLPSAETDNVADQAIQADRRQEQRSRAEDGE